MSQPHRRRRTPLVVIHAHQAVTTSLAIAEYFGKRHDNILARIEKLKAECPPDFNALNFKAVEFTDAKGEFRPAYEMTRDGFTLLAMGFTGAKALHFKLAYIERFNRMEAKLAGRPLPQPQPRAAIEPPKAPEFDVRRLLLEGQSTPTVPLPAEVQSAINRRAWALAHEAYELCRAHLARRVAYTSEVGMPRTLNEARALEVIEQGDLSDALAHAYHARLHDLTFHIRYVMDEATKLYGKLQRPRLKAK
ncbi:MAG TPA: Rha family transcriptional regulator [Burkholderiales bacterium]